LEKEIDVKALSKYDGKEGNKTYIAHGGRVIDVSESPLWKDGVHMGRHHAGKDLTADIQAAPHGTEVLERYPQVATVHKQAPEGQRMPHLISSLLARYPLLKRHPHPVMAHFPIVFSLSAGFFSVLFAVTGNRSFDQTAFYCLIAALFFTPLAILTGLFTWWVNYQARPMRPITIKLALSLTMLPVLAGLLVWRGFVPDVPDLSGAGMVYLLLVVLLAPAVLIIGYEGATLTFPLEKD